MPPKRSYPCDCFFCQTSQTAKKFGASSNGTFSEIIFSHPNLSAFCISSVLRISYKKVFVNQFFETKTYSVRLHKKQEQILCKQNNKQIHSNFAPLYALIFRSVQNRKLLPRSRLSNILSEIWSQILSGCPSVTDSDENKNLFINITPY